MHLNSFEMFLFFILICLYLEQMEDDIWWNKYVYTASVSAWATTIVNGATQALNGVEAKESAQWNHHQVRMSKMGYQLLCIALWELWLTNSQHAYLRFACAC